MRCEAAAGFGVEMVVVLFFMAFVGGVVVVVIVVGIALIHGTFLGPAEQRTNIPLGLFVLRICLPEIVSQ